MRASRAGWRAMMGAPAWMRKCHICGKELQTDGSTVVEGKVVTEDGDAVCSDECERKFRDEKAVLCEG